MSRDWRPQWSGVAIAVTALAVPTGCSPTPPADTAATTVSATATTPVTRAPAPPPPPSVAPAETRPWVALQTGDCLADPPPADPAVVLVTVVDCAAPHAAEVFRRVPVPVNDAVTDVADVECAAGFTDYTGVAVGDSRYAMTYLIDSMQDRTGAVPEPSTVICLLHSRDGGPTTGTARR
ncbi:hypothetical protein [Mycolicibacillus trivialis]|uniref:hypothetical protein n=1 Tax=Mycolicibacillus trivialis TaxID=1798 RepID=UPI000D6A71A3|nr:hypothetical protein [Mycolicibacillus trivialis]